MKEDVSWRLILSVKPKSALEWESLAKNSGFKAKKLASTMGISTRTLERHFAEFFGISPQLWLDNLREFEARRLMKHGFSTKEIAFSLGYSHVSSFCRRFKRDHGVEPKVFRGSLSPNDNSLSQVANSAELSVA